MTVGLLSPRLPKKRFTTTASSFIALTGADESTLQRVLSLVGNKAAIEITGLCGYYTMVAMTLNAFGIGTDAAPKNQTTKHQAKL